MMKNPYIPYRVNIIDAWFETPGDRCIKTFKVTFADDKVRETWSHRPGQCAMVGIPGVGESMFCISSSPTEKEYLRFSIMRVGKVTQAMHTLEQGESFYIRGPYGNAFPVDDWKGRDIVTIGGGIGQAPLRPVIQYVRDNRSDFGDLKLVYGARTSVDHCFKAEFEEISQKGDCACHLSVDVEEEDWPHYVGFVPSLLMDVAPSPDNAIAVTCGPPVMIGFVLKNLMELGFRPEQIYTTLENRMKCGIGKCGRCNVGNLYVCKDGPVFRYDQIKDVPESTA